MKKLLSLLASASLVASASATVVACNEPTPSTEPTDQTDTEITATLALKDTSKSTIKKGYENTVEVNLSNELPEGETLTLTGTTNLLTISDATKDSSDSKKYTFNLAYNTNEDKSGYLGLESLVTSFFNGKVNPEKLSLKLGTKTLSSLELAIGIYNLDLSELQKFLQSEDIIKMIKGFIPENFKQLSEDIEPILKSLFSLQKDESLTNEQDYYSFYIQNNLLSKIELIITGLSFIDLGEMKKFQAYIEPVIYAILGVDYETGEITLSESIFNLTIDKNELSLSIKQLDTDLINKIIADIIENYNLDAEAEDENQITKEDLGFDASIFENFVFSGNFKIALTEPTSNSDEEPVN